MPIASIYPNLPQVETNVYCTPAGLVKSEGVVAGTGNLPVTASPNSAVASASWNLTAIAAGANLTKVLTIPGINAGDYVEVSCVPLPPAGVSILPSCQSGTVTLNAINNGVTASPTATIVVTVTVWSAGEIQAEEALDLRGR
jgi:hypothetical protein